MQFAIYQYAIIIYIRVTVSDQQSMGFDTHLNGKIVFITFIKTCV